MDVEAQSEAINEIGIAAPADALESIFFVHYASVVNVISRIIRDPARAEELAVEAFLKFPSGGTVVPDLQRPWLIRTGARLGLDELRRQKRSQRYSGWLQFLRPVQTPEELHQVSQERDRVRDILSILPRRDAELLLLRAEGLSYAELAKAIRLNEASVGTMLARAQRTFRQEYIRRYGDE
jgi:RNA polymerase sigma factor (sigma-70 family)